MADPTSPTSTIDEEAGEDDDVDSEIISAPPPATGGVSDKGDDSEAAAGASANRHYVPPARTGTFSSLTAARKRRRNKALTAYPSWEKRPGPRRPYHEYVHELVEGGWDMMRDLDAYLGTDLEDARLAISVLDIAPNGTHTKRWPDIHDESDLARFMQDHGDREQGAVRLYMAEQQGGLAAGVIEALGSGLDLDPRFFQWTLFGHRHVLSPSHRHHAPFVSIGFGVPKLDTPNRTDAERFKVTVYVSPDDEGQGWTGEDPALRPRLVHG